MFVAHDPLRSYFYECQKNDIYPLIMSVFKKVKYWQLFAIKVKLLWKEYRNDPKFSDR